MAPTKPTPAAQPSTPRENRQAVLTGRVEDAPGNSPNTPSNQRFSRVLALGSPSQHPTPLGRPRGSKKGSGGKYGRCPDCKIGRRERGRFNPMGFSPHKGKFRFTCSQRKGDQPCHYSEVLDSDPADDPAVYRDPGVLPSIEFDEEEEEDDDDVLIVSPSKVPKKRTKATGRIAASGIFGKNIQKMDADEDSSQQKLGCPQCMKGKLVQKTRDNLLSLETVLVCEKIWNGDQASGGCGYTMDLGIEPVGGNKKAAAASTAADDDDEVEITKVVRTPDAKKKQFGVPKPTPALKKQKQQTLNDWVAEERDRAMRNPLAAAFMAGPPAEKIKDKPKKKKIVVDLTSDDELPRISPSRKAKLANRAMGNAIGPQAPIIIKDDDDNKLKPAVEFEDLGSEDELQLIELADKAEDARDELNQNEEPKLI
ncbi:hypothetical protein N658DRAFT_558008 [Parathielavia hyrcaniae]|uniref:Uncharacterized protein n=1 Tax=Parathielavia hyrcaniae TaxID=113614 RepID=A0AAN6T3J0_9PEZI|nr:hypothetical protein N658DRAFT_558008 [Parathielavia hyrcaniae]